MSNLRDSVKKSGSILTECKDYSNEIKGVHLNVTEFVSELTELIKHYINQGLAQLCHTVSYYVREGASERPLSHVESVSAHFNFKGRMRG